MELAITNNKWPTKEWVNKSFDSFEEFIWSYLDQSKQLAYSSSQWERLKKTDAQKAGKAKAVNPFCAGSLLKSPGGVDHSNVVTAALLVLDFDAKTNKTPFSESDYRACIDSLTSGGYTFFAYTSASHNPAKGYRWRVVLPTKKPLTSDDIKTAYQLLPTIDPVFAHIDQATKNVNRVWFAPAHCNDVEPLSVYQPGKLFDLAELKKVQANDLVAAFAPSHAANSVPSSAFVPGAPGAIGFKPLEAPGAIGIVNRYFGTVKEVFNRGLLAQTWTYPAPDNPARAILNDSTSGIAGGEFVDQDTVLRVHHSGKRDRNQFGAFDLLKYYRYGQDNRTKTDTTIESICNDEAIPQDLKTRLREYRTGVSAATVGNWFNDLELSHMGKVKVTAQNIATILANDPVFSTLYIDPRTERYYTTVEVPQLHHPLKEYGDSDSIAATVYPVVNLDSFRARMRQYIASTYKMDYVPPALLNDALDAILTGNRRVDPARVMFNTLPEWDGTPRAAKLFTSMWALHNPMPTMVTDEELTKLVDNICLLTLQAVYMRTMRPGCKWDYVPILIGDQGTGKSTLLRELCVALDYKGTGLTPLYREYSWSYLKDPRKVLENIGGAAIVELGEMSGLKTTDTNEIKQFVTQCEDTARSAYARDAKTTPRRWVMIGTTNNRGFLRDMTGNRRFLPIYLGRPIRDPFTCNNPDDYEHLQQVWAEIAQLCNDRPPLLTLDKDAESKRILELLQKQALDTGDYAETVESVLELPLPSNYATWSNTERKAYYVTVLTNDLHPIVDGKPHEWRAANKPVFASDATLNMRGVMPLEELAEIVCAVKRVPNTTALKRQVEQAILGNSAWEKPASATISIPYNANRTAKQPRTRNGYQIKDPLLTDAQREKQQDTIAKIDKIFSSIRW